MEKLIIINKTEQITVCINFAVALIFYKILKDRDLCGCRWEILTFNVLYDLKLSINEPKKYDKKLLLLKKKLFNSYKKTGYKSIIKGNINSVLFLTKNICCSYSRIWRFSKSILLCKINQIRHYMLYVYTIYMDIPSLWHRCFFVA